MLLAKQYCNPHALHTAKKAFSRAKAETKEANVKIKYTRSRLKSLICQVKAAKAAKAADKASKAAKQAKQQAKEAAALAPILLKEACNDYNDNDDDNNNNAAAARQQAREAC